MLNRCSKFLCGLLFTLFTFGYLFLYQVDVMRVTQHIASGGKTIYHPLLGAILITAVLQLLQIGINSLLHLKKRGYAFTYFPSTLLLAMLTSLSHTTQSKIELGVWSWLSPLLLFIYGFVVFYIKKYEPYEEDVRKGGMPLYLLWFNLSIMAALLLMVGWIGNANRLFHQRLKMETLIQNRRYTDALYIAKQISQPDSVCSMLTIYSLAREGKLGDSLFHYPLIGSSQVMRPGKIHASLISDSLLIKATEKSANYRLIGYLLDRKLKQFATELPLYFPIDSLRPLYYQEAYQLYQQLSQQGKKTQTFARGSYSAYYFQRK